MLALETSGNWTAATWTVTIAGTTHVYTFADTNAYEVMEGFKAWVPTQWAGKSVVWTWTRYTYDAGAKLHLEFNTAAHIVPNATAITLVGFGDWNSAYHDASTSAVGTWAPTLPIAVAKHARLLGDGDVGGGNLVRPGVPGLAGLRPTVEALGTVLDAARLASVLATATTPRRCWVYQIHKATWRNYALGNVSRSAQDTTAYRFSLEVAGEAI